MNFTLDENIKRLRMKFGLNQVEFAKKLGVTKQCVSNWENDNVVPSVDMLVKIADFFKVSTDSLLGRDVAGYIDASKLSEEQRAHICLIINDFQTLLDKK